MYADTNIYCRPFDERLNQRIELEAEACSDIFLAIERGAHELIGSDILLYKFKGVTSVKRLHVSKFLRLCSAMIPLTEEVESKAAEYAKKTGLSDRDALHLASAVIGKADIVLTCDDRFLTKAGKLSLQGITVENPLLFSNKL